MRHSPRTALIPIATSFGEGGCLARIQADRADGDGAINSQIVGLKEWGLQEAGAIAFGALRRLHLKPRGLSLAQRTMPRIALPALSLSNGPDLHGLNPENARSAELGLALALGMYASQTADHVVMATGCLAHNSIAPSAETDDVRILPVEHFEAKLAAVREWLATNKGAALPKRLFFFVPEKTYDDMLTIEVFRSQIEDLVRVYTDSGVALEIRPVSSLRAALAVLGATSFQSTLSDRLVLAGVFGLLLLGAAAAGAYWLLTAPLHLAFGDITLSTGEAVGSPMRAAFNTRTGDFEMSPACVNAQQLRVFKPGDSLIFRARLKNDYSVDSILVPYHFVVISVSERSGANVFPPETFGRPAQVSPGLGWDMSVVLPIRGPAEEGKIVILVRKLWPFEASKIRGDVNQVMDAVKAGQRINAAVSYLSRYAPGYLDYSFVVTDSDFECAPV